MGAIVLGDFVEVLDEATKGKVVAIENNSITIETEDGFALVFSRDQLVKSGGAIEVTNYEAFQVKKTKETPHFKTVTLGTLYFKKKNQLHPPIKKWEPSEPSFPTKKKLENPLFKNKKLICLQKIIMYSFLFLTIILSYFS